MANNKNDEFIQKLLKDENLRKEFLVRIKDQRNDELKEKKRTDIFVEMVDFLGVGEQTEKGIVRLIERHEFESAPSQRIERFYFIENGEIEFKAIKDPSASAPIIPNGRNGNERENWNIERTDIEKCIKTRREQLINELEMDKEKAEDLSDTDLEYERSLRISMMKECARELGIDEKEIQKIYGIDLKQKTSKEKDEDELSDEQVKSIGIKNAVNLNSPIDTRGTTLGKELGMEEYEKIMVIHSYKMTDIANENGEKGKRENQKFGFIAQRKDGTYVKIPETKLRMYRGENREVTAIKNPEEIETSQNDCIFEIVGTNKRLTIRPDSYGILGVYLTNPTHDNDRSIAEKLQNEIENGTETTREEVRELYNKDKGIYQADRMIGELESHEKAGCDKVKLENVDGNEGTGHQHDKHDIMVQILNPVEYLHNKIIGRIKDSCGISEDGAEEYLKKVVEKMTENEKNELQEKTEEEIIEMIDSKAQEIAAQEIGAALRNMSKYL